MHDLVFFPEEEDGRVCLIILRKVELGLAGEVARCRCFISVHLFLILPLFHFKSFPFQKLQYAVISNQVSGTNDHECMTILL